MFHVQLSCGCCHENLNITQEEAANLAAWMNANRGSSMILHYTDRHGKPHALEGVDTFYGIREGSQPESPLQRLADERASVALADGWGVDLVHEAWSRLGATAEIDELIEQVDGRETHSLRLVTAAGQIVLVTPFENWVDGRLTVWGPRLHLDHKDSVTTVVPFSAYPFRSSAGGEHELAMPELIEMLKAHTIVGIGREMMRTGSPLLVELDGHSTWLRFRMAEPDGDAPRRIYATLTALQPKA